MEELSFDSGRVAQSSLKGEYGCTSSWPVRDVVGAVDIPTVPFSSARLGKQSESKFEPRLAPAQWAFEMAASGPALSLTFLQLKGGMSSPRPRPSEGPLHFRQWRQSGRAIFSCKNISLLAALLAINYKEHVGLALKVSTPDESSAIGQDLAAAFVANRIGYTSLSHPPPSQFGSSLV
jgi:hypothetical protein